MLDQILFICILIIAIIFLILSFRKIFKNFKNTHKEETFSWKEWPQRLKITLKVAFGQSKIFRIPISGLLHALVFWGFLVITIGSIEMIIDGISNYERVFSFLGWFYDIIMASGDILALVVFLSVLGFIARRSFLHIKRLQGYEIKKKMKWDAKIALVLICWLMVSLLGLNTTYILRNQAIFEPIKGVFPVSNLISQFFPGEKIRTLQDMHQVYWWFHVLIILVFANILPYSKHFHVFMSIPNVFTSRIKPLGYIPPIESIKYEAQLILQPDKANTLVDIPPPNRFGAKDVNDLSWKNYLDSLSCTQCGRCTNVCPANITGKKLSPRKIMMDTRERMRQKAKEKKGLQPTERSLLNDFISKEELWACTMCNACAQECPININQPSIILKMRQYLVLEEADIQAETQQTFSNIENNGAPWAFSPDERENWSKEPLPIIKNKKENIDYLFWIGSVGVFDDRYKAVIHAFFNILKLADIKFAILGSEESDSADAARRLGNELLYQLQSFHNIEILNNYNIKNIITCDPHDYNTFKNEYPDFGGNYNVYHHSQFIIKLIQEQKLQFHTDNKFKDQRFVFHDPCYLGRANNDYNSVRDIIRYANLELIEMPRHKSNSLCCGAGGGQMFKEAEKGNKEVYDERSSEAIKTNANILITACPFCMTMLTDGIKLKNQSDNLKVMDIAEIAWEIIKNQEIKK
ncbi:MAG: heterodisulfide reductase-related iron-sulfur binding cluster [Bacteroidales bacterium]